ncbi:Rpn family recombination-promoting nuclease/putative transposase [Bacillus sp. FJAT-22090]|uniref:Rpn family recombination-promoting nuclease/putative transposase n=1 Tax=Bacillus sp. FJAT-22090 TaxID=1581038 RepID=UPI001642DBFC|nr:Rpn family recombination-promoting nuclease/putative transposase [Bacillus sp. FJAT-22090]
MVQYYIDWSQLYSDQLIKSMSYIELNATITVNILNFDLFSKTDLFHTTYHLYKDEEKFRMDDMMEFHFIEIPKLLQHGKEERLDPWNDVLVRWLLLLGIVDHRKGIKNWRKSP